MTSNITTGASDTGSAGRNSRPGLRDCLGDRCGSEGNAPRSGRTGGYGWRAGRKLVAGLLVLAAAVPSLLRAQSDAAGPAAVADRYLLIVETSSAMQRRADAVQGAVWSLLGSGLDGEFRDGGTLGVWTFNQDLSTGRLPLQTWSYSAEKDIAERTINFLKGQKYGKRASFDKLAPVLTRLIGDSESITVVLISSGECKLRGTPFDDRINAAYGRFREQQQKGRMPFVTVLRARHGQMLDFVVNTPPWQLHLPRLAEEHRAATAPHDQPAEAQRKALPARVAPVIISGKKPQPEPAPAPVSEPKLEAVKAPEGKAAAPAPAKPEVVPPLTPPKPTPEPVPGNIAPLPAVVAEAATKEPSAVQPPEPTAVPAQAAKTQAAPAVPEQPATEPTPKPAPAPMPASEPKAEAVKVPEAKAAEPAPAKPEVVAAAPAPKPAVEPTPAKIESSQPVVAAAATNLPLIIKSPAPHVVSGVRPSPGAATRDATQLGSEHTDLAAPGDGRNPTLNKDPAPPVQAAEVAKPQPAPVAPEPPAPQAPPNPAPAPAPVSEPKAEVVKAVAPKPAEPAAVKAPVPALEIVPMPRPEPQTVEQPTPAAAPEVKTERAPAPAVAAGISPSAGADAITVRARSADMSSVPPPPPSRPSPSTRSSMAALADSVLSSPNIGIAGALLAIIAGGFAFFLMRRPRTVPPGSFITRSLEREKGQ